MDYDIYISNLDRTKVLRLPIIPENLPQISRQSKNDTFETSDGEYNIIGPVGLGTLEIKSFLPPVGVNYYFQKVKDVNPDEYIVFLDTQRLNKLPIRLIVSRSNGTYYINETFSIDSLNWYEDRFGRYQYELSLKQWRQY